MDRFDEIWRNRFQQDEIEPAPWNTPGENVWKAIEKGVLLEKRRKRKPFIFLLLGALALGATLLYMGLQNGEIAELTGLGSEIGVKTSLQSEQSEAESSYEISPAESKSTSADKADGTVELMTPQTSVAGVPGTSNVELESTFPASESLTTTAEEVASGIDDKPPVLSEQQPVHLRDQSPLYREGTGFESFEESFFSGDGGFLSKNIAEVSTTGISATEKLLPRELSLFSLSDIDNLQENIHLRFSDNTETLADDLKFFGSGLRSGLAVWATSVNSTYREDLVAFDFDYSRRDMGWFAGLEIFYSLNSKLDFSAGFVYERATGSSHHNSSLKYGVSSEDPQSHSHNYSELVATPFGFASAEFSLIRNSEVEGDEIDLLADFESEHTIENYSFPLTLRYFPLERGGNFTPFITAGVGINRLSVVQNTLKKVDPGHEAFDFKPLESNTNLTTELQQTHIDARLSLGLNANIGENWSANLSIEYIRGMSKIFESGPYYSRINRGWVSISAQRQLF
ncbi:MAG: hypothetical protein EA411_06520 [Saprospirales bacterium]|nr:MAG: hypothetical protein EA411_06520 [Saprospirales bacterium]